MRGVARQLWVLLSVLLLGVATLTVPVAAQAAPEPRAIDDPCPAGAVPPSGFVDVAPDNVHELAVRCAAWWGVTQGRTASRFAPGEGVTRAQMASFIARLIRLTDTPLPPGPDAFGDDNGSVHEDNINALAAVNIVQGKIVGTYGPAQVVPRDQMATFLVRAFEYILEPLPESGDFFSDDQTSTHHANINKAAAYGITAGVGGGIYRPNAPVQRDQMASFLMRTLDLIAEELPEAPVLPPDRGGERPGPEPDPGDGDDDEEPGDDESSISVRRIEPSFGDSHGELEVTVVGRGFQEGTQVAFADRQSGPTSVGGSGTRIFTTTPNLAHLWGDADREEEKCVDVVVRNPDGAVAVGKEKYCLFYLDEPLYPRLIEAYPEEGPEDGGTVITARGVAQPGEGFSRRATVWFYFNCENSSGCDLVPAPKVEYISRSELKITTPPGKGIVKWEIDQADYGDATGTFRYIPRLPEADK